MYLVTYCNDIKALVLELEKLAYEGWVDKTNTVRSGRESVAVLSLDANEYAFVKKIKSLRILSKSTKEKFLIRNMTAGSLAIYERVTSSRVLYGTFWHGE